MKELYVEMIDNWSAMMRIEMGLKTVNHSRVVKIPLTDEQEILLQPRLVGTKEGNIPVFEEIRVISIQEDR